MMNTSAPVVIAVAPTGARKTKTDHPRLPISPSEIVAEAEACLAAGVSMIHLHVRDADDQHTLDPDIYRVAIDTVQGAVGDALVVQMTTEAVGRYSAGEQINAVQAVTPEAVSIALREIVPDTASEDRASAFFHWLNERQVLAQFILYAPEEVATYIGLCERGVISGREHSVLFVLGRYTTDQQSSPSDLDPFVERYTELQVGVPWMVCAFGKQEAECMAAAIEMGGHARVGFENNQLRRDGSDAAGNADAVADAAGAARALGRPIANAATARDVLGGRSTMPD
jgi:3-keto-5-aminohexanoate cleavage enzyme